jgi:serine/threonine protein kinase/tetratricopeptide (TPR) repeat protein
MTEAPLNHPGDDALRALSSGQLTEADAAQVCGHLGECPACCRRIDQLATDDRLLARLQQTAASPEAAIVTPAQRRAAVRALRESDEPASATRTREPEAAPVNLPAPRQVGEYDVLAEVGRGGMGVVYKARHRGLHRLAALKMVLAGEFASPTQEVRFRLEAELAARVQHPNIVQVYEIGSYAGRPYLALEWVEGGSLANRLDGKPWPPGEAAALIETLARAIDVAHSEGVVHRDLKPANILLAVEDGGRRVEDGKRAVEDGAWRVEDGKKAVEGGKPQGKKYGYPDLQGTGSLAVGHGPGGGVASLTTLHPPPFTLHPKITDFGLAQPIEGGQTLTQSGFLVGTPGYMAPEQASGKRALVGPATDIHALGVMLYQLLTGQLPFQRDSTLELLRAVSSDEPSRPRRLQPRLPRDLEAITLHCLEKEPSRRYPSALALAEDLARFRGGEQVMARPVGEIERLWRWCRRKPVIAGLLTSLVLAVSLGLVGMSRAYFVAESARHAETEKRREADEQRERAERARDRTRQALDAMTSSVTGDSLMTQMEINGEQKKFLTEVLTYYKEFAAQKENDEQSRSRTARAAFRVSLIEYRLGRKTEAAAAIRLACDGYANLAADFPANPEYGYELAGSQMNLGVMLSDLGMRPEAEKQYRQALSICAKLATGFPTVPAYRNYLALSHFNLGDLLRGLGKPTEAWEQYRQALTVCEKLVADSPEMPEYRLRLASNLACLGDLLRELGNPAQAEEHLRKALAIQEKLANEFPAVPEQRERLAKILNSLGVLLRELGKLPKAEEPYRQALAIRQKLAAEFPAVPEYRDGLVCSYVNLGILLSDLRKWPEAEEQYRCALAICEKLVVNFPTVPAYQVGLGGLCCNFGILVSASGRPSDCLVWFDKAILTLTPVYEHDRGFAVPGQFLRNSYAARAEAYGLLHKYAEAVRDLDKAVELSTNKEQPKLRAERSIVRLMAGQVAEAMAEVAELSKTPNWNAGQWYDFACVYAVASGKFADKKQEYADGAMELLRRAVQAGYRDAAHVKQDSDLDSLRGRDDFQQLLAELAK